VAWLESKEGIFWFPTKEEAESFADANLIEDYNIVE
jgi:hypothetical protein